MNILLARILVLVLPIVAAVDDGPAGRADALPITQPTWEPSLQFLYGTVLTVDGETYEGRLRFGGDEEAFWGEYFNGARKGNPWAEFVSPDDLTVPVSVALFGRAWRVWKRRVSLDRPFMARFGDIARIDASGRRILVTLKSGSVHTLNRYGADDLADGVRVWDRESGPLDLDEWRIQSITFHPSIAAGDIPDRLFGTVTSRQGVYAGFLQWDRERGAIGDELVGVVDGSERRIPFHTIRSIEPAGDAALVTLRSGGRVSLVGQGDRRIGARGLYVNDSRYGRVLVSPEAVIRVDLSQGGDGRSFEDFPPGRPLMGRVVTCDGTRLTGRLVYDLDESETTESLDAPLDGVDYSIPFELISSIDRRACKDSETSHAVIELGSGESLTLEARGDLAPENAGLLVFGPDQERPDYVRWTHVARLELDTFADDQSADR